MSNHKLAVSRGLSPLNKPTSALTTHATRNAATPNAASMTKLLTDLTIAVSVAGPTAQHMPTEGTPGVHSTALFRLPLIAHDLGQPAGFDADSRVISDRGISPTLPRKRGRTSSTYPHI